MAKDVHIPTLAERRDVHSRYYVFPRCPQCGGAALYRPGNVYPAECLSCGLKGIEEKVARTPKG